MKDAEIRIVPTHFVPIVVVICPVMLERGLQRGRLVPVPTGTRKCQVACDRTMHRRALSLLIDSALSIVFDKWLQLLIDYAWVLFL